MTAPPSLFEADEPHVAVAPSGLFADIVFDRPLDHAYTYAVPDFLAAKVGPGKRVEAPFGKGGKATPGFCVRVTDRPPSATFEVKTVTRVLDGDALVDDHLMKLTRWMADYYLCGWGQVLHAVVPAGVRENAGTRQAVFVETVPKEDLPNPLPAVSPQQKVAITALKKEGRPLELGQLARLAKCSTGVVASLVKKGLMRKFTERIENGASRAGHGTGDGQDPSGGQDPSVDTLGSPEPIQLNADQTREAMGMTVVPHFAADEIESGELNARGDLSMWKRFNGADAAWPSTSM